MKPSSSPPPARSGDISSRVARRASALDCSRTSAVMPADVLEQSKAEARRATRLEISPDRAGGGLELGFILRIGLAVRYAKADCVAQITHGYLPVKKCPWAGLSPLARCEKSHTGASRAN